MFANILATVVNFPLQLLLSEVVVVDFVSQITCPGTRHLTDRNMLFLSVCILGQTKRTKSVFASFPLALNERMFFERVRTTNRFSDAQLFSV